MTQTFRKVRSPASADGHSLRIHLFRGEDGVICGWYIGPLSIKNNCLRLPYLPRSNETRASLAVVRAIAEAKSDRFPICVVDPDDLWEPAWKS